VPVNGELCGAHSAQGAHNAKPVPPAPLHIYLRIRCVGGLSSNLQHTVISLRTANLRYQASFKIRITTLPGKQSLGYSRNSIYQTTSFLPSELNIFEWIFSDYCTCSFIIYVPFRCSFISANPSLFRIRWFICPVRFSASSRSLVQRSPTEYAVSECDRETSIIRRPGPTRGCCAMEERKKYAP
jgi:hypothetical protein